MPLHTLKPLRKLFQVPTWSFDSAALSSSCLIGLTCYFSVLRAVDLKIGTKARFERHFEGTVKTCVYELSPVSPHTENCFGNLPVFIFFLFLLIHAQTPGIFIWSNVVDISLVWRCSESSSLIS